jgi:hypothetical protein
MLTLPHLNPLQRVEREIPAMDRGWRKSFPAREKAGVTRLSDSFPSAQNDRETACGAQGQQDSQRLRVTENKGIRMTKKERSGRQKAAASEWRAIKGSE